VNISESLKKIGAITDPLTSKGRRRRVEPVEEVPLNPSHRSTSVPGPTDESIRPQSKTGRAPDPSTARNNRIEDLHYDPIPNDREFSKFQNRLLKGKVKICSGCGEIMTKSTRMVLSPLAGLVLVVLGTLHMFVYGLAINFMQAPWFLKFVLPAIYYVGSIFIGVGVVFFFIRERIWDCRRCKEVRKR
jgi:hypothetical protein